VPPSSSSIAGSGAGPSGTRGAGVSGVGAAGPSGASGATKTSGSQKKFSSIEALLARFPKRPEAAGAIGAAGARSLTMIVDNDVNAASARLQQSQKFVSELLDAQEDFDGVCREQDQLRTTLSSKFSHELHGAYAANESHNLR
jgi:hypothetical protein